MKIHIAGLIVSLFLISTNATARVTMEDVNRDTNALNRTALLGQDALKAQGDKEWKYFNRTPNTSGSINWSQMPAGSQCGIYMMTQNALHGYKDCQGYNPSISCPSGFTRAHLGYFEAGKGTRNFSTCMKN